MLLQLLSFPGCPHADAARRALREALTEMEHPPEVQEIDVTAADTPEHLRGWGSPTILIDGVDVAGGRPSGSSCRLYPGSDRPGVPSLDTLRAALTRSHE